MKEMQEIVAMSYTGPSHVQDSTGKYEPVKVTSARAKKAARAWEVP
jgi:hypothetical protein